MPTTAMDMFKAGQEPEATVQDLEDADIFAMVLTRSNIELNTLISLGEKWAQAVIAWEKSSAPYGLMIGSAYWQDPQSFFFETVSDVAGLKILIDHAIGGYRDQGLDVIYSVYGDEEMTEALLSLFSDNRQFGLA